MRWSVPAGNVGIGVCRGHDRLPLDADRADQRLRAAQPASASAAATPAAIDYVLYNGMQPLRTQQLKQEVGAINFSTNDLFDLLGGAGLARVRRRVSARNRSNGYVDPLLPADRRQRRHHRHVDLRQLPGDRRQVQRQGSLSSRPSCPDLRAWTSTVRCASPTIRPPARSTTWKAGLTWQLIDDVKLRGTISATSARPTCRELFAPGTGRTNTVNVPLAAGAVRADQFNEFTVGNPALHARSRQDLWRRRGVDADVSCRASRSSVDYYNIKMTGAIASLTAQTLVDQCYQQAIATACGVHLDHAAGAASSRPGCRSPASRSSRSTSSSIKTSGIDFEASYRRAIGPGNLVAARAGELCDRAQDQQRRRR